MSNNCCLCHLLRIQAPDDLVIDDHIKAVARRRLSQVEGSGLTVDEFKGFDSSADKIEPKEKRHNNSCQLSSFCRTLLKPDKDGNVPCSICGRVLTSHSRNRSQRFIVHAYIHLGKQLFKCRQCYLRYCTKPAIKRHLAKAHVLSSCKENYIDMSSGYEKDIMDILQRCFGQQNLVKSEPSEEAIRKPQRCAQAIIRSQAGLDTLLAERNLRCYELTRKFQKSGKVKCRVCQVEMLPMKGMPHVITHLNKVIYHCRLCTYSSTSRSGIREHVKLTHGRSSRNQYDDRSNDFHAEILQLISDCFDWDRESSNDRAREEHAVRNTCLIIGRSRGNDLKAARLLHCHQLAQKFAQKARVSCRICSASINVCWSIKGKNKYYFSRLLKHATCHLKKVHLFECKQCSKAANNWNTMAIHLKRVHNSTDKADFEDRTDLYHPKVMKILTKCFDLSQN